MATVAASTSPASSDSLSTPHSLKSSKEARQLAEDLEMRALEGRLQLLDAQKRFAALHCQKFLSMLESEMDGKLNGCDADDVLASPTNATAAAGRNRLTSSRSFRSSSVSAGSIPLEPGMTQNRGIQRCGSEMASFYDRPNTLSRSRSSPTHRDHIRRTSSTSRSATTPRARSRLSSNSPRESSLQTPRRRHSVRQSDVYSHHQVFSRHLGTDDGPVDDY